MSDEAHDALIVPKKRLASKVEKGGPGAVDLEMLERAEAVIANMTGDYLEWVKDDLKRIQVAIDKLQPDKDGKEPLNVIFQTSHDIKGQGGSFGYDMMTILGNDLCRFVEMIDKLRRSDIEVLKLYLNTMTLVVSKNMKGDGGKEGKQILDGLDQVVAKVSERK